MHEVSLVAELVEECLRRAGGASRPVTAVQVRYATTIPSDGLHQAFTMLTKQTSLDGVELRAEPFDQTLDCPACDFAGPLGHDDVVGAMAVCPGCGTVSALPHPVELELVGLVEADQP